MTADLVPAADVWSLLLPFERPLSLNDRDHWRVKAKRTREWREAAGWAARESRVPRCMRVEVGLTYRPADNRRRDPDNLVASLKAATDGALVDARVVPDDTDVFVARTFPVILPAGSPFRRGCRFVLTVRRLA